MKEKKLKQFPVFTTDKEAEDFVDTADLSEYDFSGFKPVHFEFAPKDKSMSLRLSNTLYEQIKKTASSQGLHTQKFIRKTLEQAVN